MREFLNNLQHYQLLLILLASFNTVYIFNHINNALFKFYKNNKQAVDLADFNFALHLNHLHICIVLVCCLLLGWYSLLVPLLSMIFYIFITLENYLIGIINGNK